MSSHLDERIFTAQLDIFSGKENKQIITTLSSLGESLLPISFVG